MGKDRKTRRPGHAKDSAAVGLDYEPPDGGWGWLVALGSFTEMFLTMGTLLCSGVYFTPIQLEFEVSSAELGWIISSGSTLLSATCPIGSACVKRFGCRMTSLIGGSAVACGFIATSFAQCSIHVFVTLGLIAGMGSGLVFVSATVILGHYFKRRYAIVNGLAFSGPGVAIFVLPPLLDYLIENYGWRGSLLIQGAIGLHTLVAAALFRPLPSEPNWCGRGQESSKHRTYARIEMEELDSRPGNKENSKPEVDQNSNLEFQDCNSLQGDVNSETGRYVKLEETTVSKVDEASLRSHESLERAENERQESADIDHVTVDSQLRPDLGGDEKSVDQSEPEACDCAEADQSKRSRRFSLDRLSFKHDCWLLYAAAFVLICPVSFFQACAFYSITFHVVARTGLVGVSAHLAGMSLSSLGAGSSFTRLTHGWFIHRGLVSGTTAYIIALVVGAVAAFGNAVSRTYAGVMLTCLIIGFSSGCVYPLVPVVLRDLVSLRGLPTTYGLAMFFDSCGVFAGGFTAGLLRDVTGTYTASFCMTGVYYSLATVFLTLVYFIMRLHRRRESAKQDEDSNKRLENGDYHSV